MNTLIMGQILLGFLAVVAILINSLFLRLGWDYRRRVENHSLLSSLLLWLPLVAVVLGIGALGIAERSLLGYPASQDVNGLSWFVIGTCLMITIDMCMGLLVIALRAALKAAERS